MLPPFFLLPVSLILRFWTGDFAPVCIRSVLSLFLHRFVCPRAHGHGLSLSAFFVFVTGTSCSLDSASTSLPVWFTLAGLSAAWCDTVLSAQCSHRSLTLLRAVCPLLFFAFSFSLISSFELVELWQDWALEFKHWPLYRIDGSTGPLERRVEMDRFQQGGDKPDAPRLFLLSTHAGGLGINLTTADTVVFYDQDWVCSFCSFRGMD